jgi:hypothetical protein
LKAADRDSTPFRKAGSLASNLCNAMSFARAGA